MGGSDRPARLPRHHPPVLLVILDAEEEFEWSAGFDSRHVDVSAIARLHAAQALFERHGIVPTYVVTHPVATRSPGRELLSGFARDGRACLGAHLHPWVTPPHEEDVCAKNSFPGNLPEALERAKLARLVAAIEEHLGVRPRVYQAGRYGLGPRTRALLEEQDFLVDCSVLPHFDYRREGGPDFRDADGAPAWVGARGELLSLPQTSGFAGWLPRGQPKVYRACATKALAALRVPAVLARSGALERLRLSPEGYDLVHNMRLVTALWSAGRQVFVFSFHTPSLKPGCTPYVRNEVDLARFLNQCRGFFEWFLGDFGGVTMTPLQLHAALAAARGA